MIADLTEWPNPEDYDWQCYGLRDRGSRDALLAAAQDYADEVPGLRIIVHGPCVALIGPREAVEVFEEWVQSQLAQAAEHVSLSAWMPGADVD